MPDSDLQLVAELRALGRGTQPAVDDPRVDALVRAVTARVAAPSPSSSRPAAPVATPPRRVPRRRIALLAGALVLTLLSVPPVRAAVLEWFGFAGVRVEQGPGGEGAPPPPAVPRGRTVAQAAASVDFPVLLPSALGRPDGVDVADDRRLVSMTWTVDGETVRLDQFDGTLDFSMAKQSPRVEFTEVGGEVALWFAEPHEVVLLDPDGTARSESARLAGHTLIWAEGATTLRLEGDLTSTEAVALAGSARPVG